MTTAELPSMCTGANLSCSVCWLEDHLWLPNSASVKELAGGQGRPADLLRGLACT